MLFDCAFRIRDLKIFQIWFNLKIIRHILSYFWICAKISSKTMIQKHSQTSPTRVKIQSEPQFKLYDPNTEFRLIQASFKVSNPLLRCPEAHEIVFICTNPSCEADSSLICNENLCLSCSVKHDRCGEIVKLRFITRQLQDQTEARKDFIMSLYRKEQEMIQKMRELRKAEVQKYLFGFLDSKLETIIRKIYVTPEKFTLNASEAITLTQELKSLTHADNQLRNQLLHNFQRQLEIKLLGLKKQQKSLISQFSQPKEVPKEPSIKPKEIQKQKIITERSSSSSSYKQEEEINRVENSFFRKRSKLRLKKIEKETVGLLKDNRLERTLADSKLIEKGTRGWNFLHQALKYPKKMVLLFRASERGFSSASFHKYCDDIPHTLTIIRTEFDKTIGGYTPLPWSFYENSYYSKDQARSSFIFSVDLLQKMELVDAQRRALKYCNISGPNFGVGYDIGISDRCDRNDQSYANFPWCYNNQNNYRRKDQGVWTAFCGATDGCKFRVKEYEVYRVEW